LANKQVPEDKEALSQSPHALPQVAHFGAWCKLKSASTDVVSAVVTVMRPAT
jgi:hypothetical protein